MANLKEHFKLGFNIFVYLSLAFLAYYLYKQQYLVIPKQFNLIWMACSLVALFIGFIANSIQWVALLKSQGLVITYRDSIRTYGMAVFGKYIPGKVWVHIGKGAQIARLYKYPLSKVSEISFFSQLLSLWSGSVVGLVVLLYIGQHDLVFWTVLGFVIIAALAISTKRIQNFLSAIIFSFTGKRFSFSSLIWFDFPRVLPLYFITNFAYGAGFFFLSKSLGALDLPVIGMFIFPLAMSIGVIAIIVPGGLGVREVVISTILVLMIIPEELSNTIAFASRLWFLVGETFIFSLGLFLQFRSKSMGTAIAVGFNKTVS